jgi:mitotic spindle assembly checkpoint protein MAD2
MAVADPKLSGYLASVLRQFADWLGTGTLRKAVLVVAAAATGEVRERWAFDIQTAAGALGGAGAAALPEKSAAAVAAEVQAMIRQITASVTFLPLLGDACTIDLLAYTDREGDVPLEWEESDPRLIAGGEDVRLRSFSTAAHAVEALVSYRCE